MPAKPAGGGYKIPLLQGRRMLSFRGSNFYGKRGEGLIAFTVINYA